MKALFVCMRFFLANAFIIWPRQSSWIARPLLIRHASAMDVAIPTERCFEDAESEGSESDLCLQLLSSKGLVQICFLCCGFGCSHCVFSSCVGLLSFRDCHKHVEEVCNDIHGACGRQVQPVPKASIVIYTMDIGMWQPRRQYRGQAHRTERGFQAYRCKRLKSWRLSSSDARLGYREKRRINPGNVLALARHLGTSTYNLYLVIASCTIQYSLLMLAMVLLSKEAHLMFSSLHQVYNIDKIIEYYLRHFQMQQNKKELSS